MSVSTPKPSLWQRLRPNWSASRLDLWHARLREQLWFRPAWWSAMAVAVALLASAADYLLPDRFVPGIDPSALKTILTVIASSMLAVSTFSLSILVSAFASAASGATPRATRLLRANDDAQTAIAAFLSTFIYSIVALTALGIGYYGAAGRFVLLLVTMAVLAHLIFRLLAWVNTLSQIGRMSHTIQTVEQAADTAFAQYRADPAMGGVLAEPGASPSGVVITAASVGYLRSVDMAALDRVAERLGGAVHLRERPGVYAHPARPLAVLCDATPDRQALDDLRAAFDVAKERNMLQDPRHGLIVLSEIALRALSPAVNDPGTGIAILSVLGRVLIAHPPQASAATHDEKPPRYLRVTVPAIDEADFIQDAFGPLSRDAAGLLEVAIRLQKTLAAVAQNTCGKLKQQAIAQAAMAAEYAAVRLDLDSEKAQIGAMAHALRTATDAG
jgi:uncharacterized membrane protein